MLSRRVSAYSSSGDRTSLVSFQRLGVRKPYELDTAVKVALRVFSWVLVEPAEEVYESSTPASWRKRLTAGEATMPVPRGAGMSCGVC